MSCLGLRRHRRVDHRRGAVPPVRRGSRGPRADNFRCSPCTRNSRACCCSHAFEALLAKWRESGAALDAHGRASTSSPCARPLPARAVVMGEVRGTVRAAWRSRQRRRERTRRRRAERDRAVYLGAGRLARVAVARDAGAAGRCSIPTRGATRKFHARCWRAATGSFRT